MFVALQHRKDLIPQRVVVEGMVRVQQDARRADFLEQTRPKMVVADESLLVGNDICVYECRAVTSQTETGDQVWEREGFNRGMR